MRRLGQSRSQRPRSFWSARGLRFPANDKKGAPGDEVETGANGTSLDMRRIIDPPSPF